MGVPEAEAVSAAASDLDQDRGAIFEEVDGLCTRFHELMIFSCHILLDIAATGILSITLRTALPQKQNTALEVGRRVQHPGAGDVTYKCLA